MGKQWLHQAGTTQTSLKNKAEWRYAFKKRRKDTYALIREVNTQKTAYFTACEEEFGLGRGGEAGVKAHMDTDSPHQHKIVSESIKVFHLPKDTDMQLNTAATAQTNTCYHSIQTHFGAHGWLSWLSV